jgi:hypothetical protein
MDTWEIRPYTGVGPLQLGIDRTSARTLLGGKYSTFRRGPYASNDTDAFDDLGLHLEYDGNERLELIMAFGEITISYKGLTLLGRDANRVLEELAQIGAASRYFDDGHYVREGGFALTIDDNVVQAVTVYTKEYYEEMTAELQ